MATLPLVLSTLAQPPWFQAEVAHVRDTTIQRVGQNGRPAADSAAAPRS